MNNNKSTPTERINVASYEAFLKPTTLTKDFTRIGLVAIPAKVQARLDAAQTALVLGFAEHDIPVLIRAGLLKPLGDDPRANSRKYFAGCHIEMLARNDEWLGQATQAVSENWQTKNANRVKNQPVEQAVEA